MCSREEWQVYTQVGRYALLVGYNFLDGHTLLGRFVGFEHQRGVVATEAQVVRDRRTNLRV
jgi:hypothetical protein